MGITREVGLKRGMERRKVVGYEEKRRRWRRKALLTNEPVRCGSWVSQSIRSTENRMKRKFTSRFDTVYVLSNSRYRGSEALGAVR